MYKMNIARFLELNFISFVFTFKGVQENETQFTTEKFIYLTYRSSEQNMDFCSVILNCLLSHAK